jgi:hypothetical protein
MRKYWLCLVPVVAVLFVAAYFAHVSVAPKESAGGAYLWPQTAAQGIAAPGTPAYNPSWYAATSIYVDPTGANGGNDKNPCTTALAPCRTWAECVRRWGSYSPQLGIGVAANSTFEVTFLSSHTGPTDPVVWLPFMYNGSTPLLRGTTPAVAATATFTLSTAKNTAAGSNAMLSGSFSTGTPATGTLLYNTTHPSYAYIYTNKSGSVWNISQPIAGDSPGLSAPSAEVDTWATNDSVQFLSPVAVNVAVFAPTLVDFNQSTFQNQGYMDNMVGFDPNGVFGDVAYFSGVWSFNVAFQREYLNWQAATPLVNVISNCAMLGGQQQQGGSIIQWGGFAQSTYGIAGGFGTLSIDGDFILGVAGGATTEEPVAIGNMYFDANMLFAGCGAILNKNFFLGTHTLYGSAGKTISLIYGSRAYQIGTTFTGAWTLPALISPGILVDGSSAACSHGNTSPDVISCGISTTVAHLDAAQGVAGFGGNAFIFGGSSVSQTP